MSQAGSAGNGGISPSVIVETLTGNSGGAVGPTANNINVVGGTNINIVGNPGTSTLTASVSGTTNHAVQIGNAGGTLTSVSVGATGTVLTGVTGADPVWSAPAAAAFTLTGNSGVATSSASNINVVTSSTTLNFQGSGANLTLDVPANILIGESGASITTGTNNCGYGTFSLLALVSGSNNSFYGQNSGSALQSGDNNVFIGVNTGWTINGGSGNLFLGTNSGTTNTTTDSNNINLNNFGVAGESDATRIGSTQTTCYVAGIFGVTVGVTGIPVVVDSAGQLGTIVSSRKFKENIEDMGSESSDIFKLRPVTFTMKHGQDKTLSYGLIAEEVAESFPNLVVNDKYGEPHTVKYHELPALLLNEVQRMNNRISILEKHINYLENK